MRDIRKDYTRTRRLRMVGVLILSHGSLAEALISEV